MSWISVMTTNISLINMDNVKLIAISIININLYNVYAYFNNGGDIVLFSGTEAECKEYIEEVKKILNKEDDYEFNYK